MNPSVICYGNSTESGFNVSFCQSRAKAGFTPVCIVARSLSALRRSSMSSMNAIAKAIATVFILFLVSGGLVYGQDDPLKAREIFVKSRMTTDGYDEEARPEPKRKSGTTVKPSAKRRSKRSSVLGLGYNFYLNTELNNSEGKYIHVDPSRIFKSGDQIRLVVESTIDGYLYIFNQTNDGAPTMLFPNYAAYNGDNRIRAHQQYLVPGPNAIEFVGDTGTETMTIVISRTRITGLPVKQELRDNPKFEITARKFETIAAPGTVAESK